MEGIILIIDGKKALEIGKVGQFTDLKRRSKKDRGRVYTIREEGGKLILKVRNEDTKSDLNAYDVIEVRVSKKLFRKYPMKFFEINEEAGEFTLIPRKVVVDLNEMLMPKVKIIE